MVLTSREQLFIERPLHRCFCVINTHPIYSQQKQSPGGFLKNFAKFTGKHLCQSFFLIKLQALGPDIKRTWHGCFPVTFAKKIKGNTLIEFWVVNTWRAPVRKRLKRSTLNFARTFLAEFCTNLTMSCSFFIAMIRRVLKALFP